MRILSVADIFDEVADRLDNSTVGPYTIVLVDEEDVRDESEELEEFSNYAIHSDFPDVIPEGTIWLSEEVPVDERWILIEEAIARIEAEDDGLSSEEAYSVGLRRSKKLRSRASPEGRDTSAADVKIKKIGSSDGVSVWLVDGKRIRDSVDIDFVEGGHGLVYSWIPRDEIWIDEEVPKKERRIIVAHESKERALMMAGHSYEEAHKKASRFEWQIRW